MGTNTGDARRWRTIALVAVGVAIGTTLTATPVYSHVGKGFHYLRAHVLPATDKRYFKKADSEARYVNVGEKAAQASNADSVDGRSVATFNVNANAGTFSIPLISSFGGLSLEAGCVAPLGNDAIVVRVRTDTDDSYIRSPAFADSDFDTNDGENGWQTALFSEGDGTATIVFRRGPSTSVAAPVTTVTLGWDTNPPGNDCQMVGTLVGG